MTSRFVANGPGVGFLKLDVMAYINVTVPSAPRGDMAGASALALSIE